VVVKAKGCVGVVEKGGLRGNVVVKVKGGIESNQSGGRLCLIMVCDYCNDC